MDEFPRTPTNTVKRLAKRAIYDKKTIYAILDATMICHVAFVQDELPFLLPLLHARDGDHVLLHGSSSSRLMRHIQAGNPITLSVAVLDGLVLARAAFDHSVNYRSAILFCRGELVEEPGLKNEALRQFTEKLLPGRWQEVRQPSENELKATSIARLAIESASAKIRQGMPVDHEEDMSLPIWAGVIPVFEKYGEPQADPASQSAFPVPDYLQDWNEGLNS